MLYIVCLPLARVLTKGASVPPTIYSIVGGGVKQNASATQNFLASILGVILVCPVTI